MRILGIDPGTHRMGYGLVEAVGGHVRYIDCGALRAARSAPIEQRLHQLYVGVKELLESFRPQEMAVEQPFVSINPRSAIAVGQAMAVALVAAAQENISVFTYSPRQIKQAVASYGGGSKEQVQEMVRMQLSLDSPPQPLDAADALATALCHYWTHRLETLIARSSETTA